MIPDDCRVCKDAFLVAGQQSNQHTSIATPVWRTYSASCRLVTTKKGIRTAMHFPHEPDPPIRSRMLRDPYQFPSPISAARIGLQHDTADLRQRNTGQSPRARTVRIFRRLMSQRLSIGQLPCSWLRRKGVEGVVPRIVEDQRYNGTDHSFSVCANEASSPNFRISQPNCAEYLNDQSGVSMIAL